jgi:hypothetical protein
MEGFPAMRRTVLSPGTFERLSERSGARGRLQLRAIADGAGAEPPTSGPAAVARHPWLDFR